MHEIETKLNLDDWNAVKAFIQKRMQSQSRTNNFWNSVVSFGVFIAIMVAVLIVYDIFSDSESFSWVSAAIGFFFAVLAGIEMVMREQKKLKYLDPLKDGFILGRKKIKIDEQGIVVTGENFRSQVSWNAVLEIAESEKHIYLFVDKVDALVLPKRQLEDPAQVLEYLQSCHDSPGLQANKV
jgi:hypothetical protein